MSKVLSNMNSVEENKEYLRSILPVKSGRINWQESIGYTIEYKYKWKDKIYKGTLEIKKYETKKHKIYFKDINNGISTGVLQECKLGGILNFKTSNFKYELNQHIQDNRRDITIIDRKHIKENEIQPNNKIAKQNYKWYKYKCNIDNNKGWILESNLDKGFGCNICGDGFSYPEKFMYSILKQLNIEFETQFSNFDWINNIRYDFYIPSVDLILEVHGGQHGKFITKGELTFIKRTKGFGKRDDIENDIKKCWLAYDNSVENYIQLDCYYSNMEYIKNSILNSELVKKFDLSNIDWNKCEEFALSNLVKEVCDYWNEHREINSEDISTKDLAKIFKIAKNTIIDYLKRGTELGWCNYNPKEKKSNMNLVKEVCDYWREHKEVNGEDISTKDLAKIFKRDISSISKYLRKGTRLGLCNYNPKKEKQIRKKGNKKENNIELIKEVCNYWYIHREINNEDISMKDLIEYFKLNRKTIKKYLKKGTELGLCNYNGKEEQIRSAKRNGHKIDIELVKEICNYWHEHREINSENITTKDLAEYFKVTKQTIIPYLKKGTELGWCNYDPKEEKKRQYEKQSREINLYLNKIA